MAEQTLAPLRLPVSVSDSALLDNNIDSLSTESGVDPGEIGDHGMAIGGDESPALGISNSVSTDNINVGPILQEAKDQMVARLQAELTLAQDEIKAKSEKCERLDKMQRSVDKEIHELTEHLFQEAYRMVAEAKEKRTHAEKLLKEAKLKIDGLQAEVEALKILVVNATPQNAKRSSFGHAPDTSPFKRIQSSPKSGITPQKSKFSFLAHRRNNSDTSPPPFVCTECLESAEDKQLKKQIDYKEVDPVYHKEFASWRERQDPTDKAHPFLMRIYSEDIIPCFNFENNELTERVLGAIEQNVIILEPVLDQKPRVQTCALSRVPRICPFRLRLDNDSNSEWLYMSQLCRNRVRLHKRVIDSVLSYDRTHAQWDALISQALHLEEVAKNENNPIGCHRFERTYRDDRSQIIQQICIPSIEWYWECLFKRPLLRFLGGFLGVLSVFVIWSECTFFSVHPTLSLAAVFVYSAADKYSYGYIELSSVLIISFLSICAYYTVFKLRIYRYYHLDPHHHTDENSLLFSAILLCRLTPPLGLNFLGMIHLDSHITSDANFGAETSFTKLMGHMDVIPFISNGFNIYFPIGIVLLCLGTWFRLGTRCLHGLGIDQFIGEDEMTTEMVQGGKALVNVERNKQRRELNRETRQEYWNDKLGSQDRGRSLRTMGQKGSATRGAHSDDDDRTAIVPKMEQDPEMGFDNGNDPLFEQDWHRKGKLGGYGSPGEPPKGIFDDL